MLAILWIVLTYPLSFFRRRHDLAFTRGILDCATDYQCLHLWHRAQLHFAGPRFELRIGLRAAGQSETQGHRGIVGYSLCVTSASRSMWASSVSGWTGAARHTGNLF